MNLVPLYEEAIQFNNFNGTVLAAGKVEVWYLGRTRKADIYADVAGETPLPNPLDLNDLGMQEVYVNPAFNYTLVVYDPYGSELFSVDKYLQGAGAHTTSNVVVQPSEHIGVSAWTVGEVQIYQPYLVGDVGKTYEGISPIVVNNVEDKISAQHVPLGVQDPLYFVQDDEEACIIGIDSSACGKTYSGISPILVDNTANTISITGDIGKDWTEEILSAANDASAAATAWTDSQNYLTGVDLSEYAKTDFVVSSIDAATSGKYDTSSFSAISASFLTALPPDVVYSADITGLATTAQLNEKLDKSDSANFYPMTANPSGYLTAHQSLQGYATEQWVQNQGYLTSVDIPESANWNSTYNTVHDNSASWTVSGDFELSAGSGISIVDYPLEQKTVISVTAQGGNPEVEQAVIDNSATWDSVTSKADVTAIPSTAGLATESFVTSQGYITNDAITGKQDITGMTAYATVESLTTKQDVGDYLSATDSAKFLLTSDSGNFYPKNENPSGYLTTVPDTYLQNTDLTITDNKVTEISGISLAGGGGVSGTNVVFVPEYEGAEFGRYYSATISGDIVVTTGDYNEYDISPGYEYSLTSIAGNLGNKLDKSTVNDSNTLINYEGHTEVFEKAYRATGFFNGSAENVSLSQDVLSVNFDSNEIEPETHLYSAIVTIETTTTGDVPEDWKLINYENNSAILTKIFPLNEITDSINLSTYEGWNITNCEASATVYSALEIAPLAFKDDITGYQIAGDYYSASNPSGFVTSGELPDPITIGVQEGETLDTDYDGLKIVKATANGNEHINLHKKSTDQWLIHGNLVPTSPGSNKYLVTDDSGAMHWDNKSALAYDSAFEQSGGYITAYNGSAFKAGDEFPQSATEAIETVTANSADWNGTTETVSSNSGAWGGSALPISAGNGIALTMVDGILVISVTGV